MIYLDYAADTPVREEVLKTFCEATKTYVANPNAGHKLGLEAKLAITEATEKIASYLKVKPEEIIYTSGATEANNLAIKGIANEYKRYGKHMITTYLEHSSVTGPMLYLEQQGYEIDYVDLLPNGKVDTDHLKELLRPDTILVSISAVDSELGVCQDISALGEMISEYPNCHFHVDATQAIGKIQVDLEKVDLITLAPHKFFGLHGVGILIKKEMIHLEPLIHGGISTTTYRSGTPTAALILSAERALHLIKEDQKIYYDKVVTLNQLIREKLKGYNEVIINSPETASPFILNLSIKGVKPYVFQQQLAERGVFISTKSACSTANTPSRPVYALTKDRKRALATLRISLSYLTTEEEAQAFIQIFEQCYNELKK